MSSSTDRHGRLRRLGTSLFTPIVGADPERLLAELNAQRAAK